MYEPSIDERQYFHRLQIKQRGRQASLDRERKHHTLKKKCDLFKAKSYEGERETEILGISSLLTECSVSDSQISHFFVFLFLGRMPIVETAIILARRIIRIELSGRDSSS